MGEHPAKRRKLSPNNASRESDEEFELPLQRNAGTRPRKQTSKKPPARPSSYTLKAWMDTGGDVEAAANKLNRGRSDPFAIIESFYDENGTDGIIGDQPTFPPSRPAVSTAQALGKVLAKRRCTHPLQQTFPVAATPGEAARSHATSEHRFVVSSAPDNGGGGGDDGEDDAEEEDSARKLFQASLAAFGFKGLKNEKEEQTDDRPQHKRKRSKEERLAYHVNLLKRFLNEDEGERDQQAVRRVATLLPVARSCPSSSGSSASPPVVAPSRAPLAASSAAKKRTRMSRVAKRIQALPEGSTALLSADYSLEQVVDAMYSARNDTGDHCCVSPPAATTVPPPEPVASQLNSPPPTPSPPPSPPVSPPPASPPPSPAASPQPTSPPSTSPPQPRQKLTWEMMAFLEELMGR